MAKTTYLTDGHKDALRERVRVYVTGPLDPATKRPLGEPQAFTDEARDRLADDYADALMMVAHVYGWEPKKDRAPARAAVAAYLDAIRAEA